MSREAKISWAIGGESASPRPLWIYNGGRGIFFARRLMMGKVVRVNKGSASPAECASTRCPRCSASTRRTAPRCTTRTVRRGVDPGGDRPLPGHLHLLGGVTVSGTVAAAAPRLPFPAIGIARADPSGLCRIRTRSRRVPAVHPLYECDRPSRIHPDRNLHGRVASSRPPPPRPRQRPDDRGPRPRRRRCRRRARCRSPWRLERAAPHRAQPDLVPR